ncbi:beta-propeller fold lactonase family protein [Bradyrhizobium liaoningense]|uniref:beta-propeller fold lactonase family protein n=1 Tax=Bradyrhizobium liaoningense TaxID=43992 RepID=UPI0020115099|nr:beta-propeller fold lactonase family protein [Bradyrhizobium liaoningense]
MARPRSSNLFLIPLVLLLFASLQIEARASELVGHVYVQTNETQNRIIHFGRNADGQLKLLESIPTGGAGSGVFKPISGQMSAPNAFEGAGSVILAESNTLLFTTNGGDNSVTSFRVSPAGKLTLIDRQPTGEPVIGRSGTAKSLAYRPKVELYTCSMPSAPTISGHTRLPRTAS